LLSATLSRMAEQQRLDPTLLGQRVVNRRLALRLEQSDIAERSKLSRAYISRLENGLVANPKVFDLEQVAAAMGMSLAELLRPAAPNPDTAALRSNVEAIFGPDDGDLVYDAVEALARGNEQQRQDAMPIFRLLKKALDGQN
jgi:transcriptional regulator with XRE-family HTH domain